MRVAWFVSDHGWGHVSRSLMPGQALVERGHSLLMAVAPGLAAPVRAALPQAEIATGRLDRGYALHAGGRGVDPERTRPLLRDAAEVDPAVLEAVRRWAPDVIVADATPWASRVAEALGVPSVICSNFSWDDQYAALYRDDRAQDALSEVETVRSHVEAFTLALELPLGPGIPATRLRRPVPLVARRPSGAPVALPGDGPLLTWAFGRTPLPEQPLEGLRRLAALGTERGLRVAATATTAVAIPGVLPIPDDLYWPDVLAASRLVVSKAGYSTLAETLRGPAHLVSVGITGLPEERGMQRALEEAGYGRAIPWGVADAASALAAHAEALLARPQREPLLEDGSAQVVEAVVRLAGDGGDTRPAAPTR